MKDVPFHWGAAQAKAFEELKTKQPHYLHFQILVRLFKLNVMQVV
jgi:hypothetical protein